MRSGRNMMIYRATRYPSGLSARVVRRQLAAAWERGMPVRGAVEWMRRQAR
jgi:hypothetical protein